MCDNGEDDHVDTFVDCEDQDCIPDPLCGGGERFNPADCPGSDTECQQRTCVSGVCGISFAPAGTVLAAQTAIVSG